MLPRALPSPRPPPFGHLQCVPRIEYLGLGANLIGDFGLVYLADALRHGPGLAKLTGIWLGDNEAVGDVGVAALAQAARRSHLKDIYLQGTSMGMAGWSALLNLVPHNPKVAARS